MNKDSKHYKEFSIAVDQFASLLPRLPDDELLRDALGIEYKAATTKFIIYSIVDEQKFIFGRLKYSV